MLTFHSVNRSNAGTYTCHAIELTGGGPKLLESDTLDIVVNYLPSERYPICSHSAGGQAFIAFIGDSVEVTCTSEDGIPSILLKWTHNHRSNISKFTEVYQ